MYEGRWLFVVLPGACLVACTTVADFGSAMADAPRAETNLMAPPNACASADFGGVTGSLLDGVVMPGGQNIAAAMTPTASTILVQRGGCSGNLSLFVADEVPAGSGHYKSLPVPPIPSLDTLFEENVTITADGLTLVGLNANDTVFLQATRSGVGTVDFGKPSPGPFSAIVAAGTEVLWAPVLSPDGLAFYYTVKNDPDPKVNGVYESLRPNSHVPFPPGTRMPAAIQDLAQYVNAVSADRLTIFLEERAAFRAVVFTRAHVGDEFTNPLAPNPPPVMPGLRARPVAGSGCHEVIATCSPEGSGCSRERICTFSR